MTEREWIENKITDAKRIIEQNGFVKNGKIDKTVRSYFSSFGAAVIMGTVSTAVSGFWNVSKEDKTDNMPAGKTKKNTTSQKYLVVSCIYELLGGSADDVKRCKKDNKISPSGKEIADKFRSLLSGRDDVDEVLNAAASLKLACDLFERESDQDGGNDD